MVTPLTQASVSREFRDLVCLQGPGQSLLDKLAMCRTTKNQPDSGLASRGSLTVRLPYRQTLGLCPWPNTLMLGVLVFPRTSPDTACCTKIKPEPTLSTAKAKYSSCLPKSLVQGAGGQLRNRILVKHTQGSGFNHQHYQE